MQKLLIFLSAGMLVLASSQKVESQSYFRNLKQPDGTTFQAIERGDEWLRFYETPEGYIVRRGADGYYYYFDINVLGNFVGTNLRVGIDRPANVPIRPYTNPVVLRALNKKIDAYNKAAERNRQRYLQRQRSALGSNALGKGSPGVTSSQQQQQVTLNVCVLLVEFNDVQHYGGSNGYTVSDFETMLFSDDYYHTAQNQIKSPDNEDVFGSLRDYSQFQSHGLLQVTGQVINPNTNGQPQWLNMGNSSTYSPGGYWDIKPLLRDAINAAIGLGWNANYDIIALIIAQDPFAPNVGFEWGYAYFQSGTFGYSSSEFDPSFDYANWLGGYVMHEREDAEYDDPSYSRFAHIGTHCHEMFHVIGWGLPNILGQGNAI